MSLIKHFAAALTLVGGSMSAFGQACIGNSDGTMSCVDSGSISSDRALPPGAYRLENGRRVPVQPGRFEPVRPGHFEPVQPGVREPVRPGIYSGRPQGRVVFPVVALENEKGNLYCDTRILLNHMPRNIGDLCIKFTRALGDGTPIEPVPNPFTRQFEISQNRRSFCRQNSEFGQAGKAITLNLYEVYPAGSPIDCIVVGYDR